MSYLNNSFCSQSLFFEPSSHAQHLLCNPLLLIPSKDNKCSDRSDGSVKALPFDKPTLFVEEESCLLNSQEGS